MSLISLTDAKSWLRYPNPAMPHADDAAIQNVIDACQDMLEGRVGITVPQTFDEYYTPSGTKLWLRNTPVIEILEITESWQLVNFELNFQAPDTGVIIGGPPGGAPATQMFAYSVDEPSTGEITRRGAANVPLPFYPSDRGVRVIYRAGRSPMPASIILAAKELVAHLWQNSQLRAVATTGAFAGFDSVEGITRDMPGGAQSLWVGVPNRIIQMIQSEMTRLPFIA